MFSGSAGDAPMPYNRRRRRDMNLYASRRSTLLLMLLAPLLGAGGATAPATAPAAKLSGTIVDAAGAPLAGFTLDLVHIEPAAAPRSGLLDGSPDFFSERVIATQTTDPDGTFTFDNVPPGDYLLRGGSKETGFVYHDVKIKNTGPIDVGKLQAVKV
jgi:hypothetical protein